MTWDRKLGPDEAAFVQARIAQYRQAYLERGVEFPEPPALTNSISVTTYLSMLRERLTGSEALRLCAGEGVPVTDVTERKSDARADDT